MRKSAVLLISQLVLIMLFPAFTAAKEVGLVVLLRGEASTLRETRTYSLSLKDDILLEDRVETMDRTRMKMLFDDDSMLTLGARSKLVVKEYYSRQEERGKAVVNLLEGRLKSLVGRNELEVHTSTALTAARGTYFIVWIEMVDGTPVTNVTVLEGTVEVFNIDPAIKGVVEVEPGTMTRVFENSPPEPPAPVPVEIMQDIDTGAFDAAEEPAAEEETGAEEAAAEEAAAEEETATAEEDTSAEAAEAEAAAPEVAAEEPAMETQAVTAEIEMFDITQDVPVTQPIESQQPANTTPVLIRVKLPQVGL